MKRSSSVWKRILALKKTAIYARSAKYMPICKLFVLLSKIFYSLFFFVINLINFIIHMYSIYKSQDQADILDYNAKNTHTEMDVILKACAYIIEGLNKDLQIFPRWLV
jgi:hypothetical protein